MKNYYVEFMNHVSKDISKLIEKLIDKSEEMNIKLYLTGGMVRDFFLNVETIDVDIIVDGDHERFVKEVMINVLSEKFIKYSYNDSLMTATFTLDYCNLDIVQMRSEIYDCPGSLPQIFPDSLFKDCHRRDYTINSLYFELSKYNFKLIDMDNYVRDIKDKALKVHHNASFSDDPTRILRGVKYKTRFDFYFDTKTLNLINISISDKCFSTISKERLAKEFTLLLKEKKHQANIKELCKLDVDLSILGVKIDSDYANYIDYQEVNKENNTLIYKILELIYINRKIVPYENIIKYTNNKRAVALVELVYKVDDIHEELNSYDYLTLCSYMDKLTKVELRFLEVRANQEVKVKIMNWNTIKNIQPKFNGDYIIEQGIRDGRTIGKILREYKNKLYIKVLSSTQKIDEQKIIDEIISQEKSNGI